MKKKVVTMLISGWPHCSSFHETFSSIPTPS